MVLAWLFFFVSAFSGASSNSIPRAATTEATCIQGYSWTMNAQNQSPCYLAAAIIAPCSSSGTWNIPSLTGSNHYNSPSAFNNTVNSCYCSWATYNLLNACTACQGLLDSITTWVSFSQDCGPKVSQEDFYTSGAIEVNAAIPYYATQNPKNWTGGKFDVAQAQQIKGQDVNLAERPVTSSTSTAASPTVTVPTDSGHVSIGAIAGGTVVGFVVVCVGAALVIYYSCRRRRSRPQTAGEDQDHLLARESPSRPETIVSPFPWSLSPPPSMPPSREKSPPISMTETNTRTVSRSNTSRVSSSRSTSRAGHTHVATFTVEPEEDVALDPASLLPIPQTSPPPYRHTPEMTPAFLQFLTSPGAAPSHEDYHCSSLHRPDISSTWDSLGSRAEMIDSSFASVSRTSSPPFHSSLVSPRSERPYPSVRFGTSNDGHIDEDDLVHRIA